MKRTKSKCFRALKAGNMGMKFGAVNQKLKEKKSEINY